MSGSPNTGDTGGTTPPPDNTTPPAGGDWIASLSPELKQVVEVKGYKTPADVVQAYAHAQKAIGTDKITVPKDGVWDDMAREKLGIPKDATGYEVKRPDNLPAGLNYDEKFEQAALPIAHKLGLTPSQVAGLMEFYTGYQSEGFKSIQVEAQRSMDDAQALLKKEWGTAFDVNAQRAKIAAKHFGGDALVNFLNASGMGNSPELIRAFAKIGGQMTEDQLRVGQGSGFGVTPEQARREANRLMATEAYRNGSHPEHQEAVEKVSTLFKQAYPE
jgi:hypothetical protein